MDPDTFDVLKKGGCLNKDRFAARIASLYLANADVKTLADSPDELALVADETRDSLFGNGYSDDVAYDLNERITELTRPMGEVYDVLPDDYSLCTARVRRKTQTEDGVSIIVTKTARFVSGDPDVVAFYRSDPMIQRLERTIERTAGALAEDTRRIPALASRTRPMIQRANGVMRRELPMPQQNGQP